MCQCRGQAGPNDKPWSERILETAQGKAVVASGMVCVLCFFSRERTKQIIHKKSGQFPLAYTFNLEERPACVCGKLVPTLG